MNVYHIPNGNVSVMLSTRSRLMRLSLLIQVRQRKRKSLVHTPARTPAGDSHKPYISCLSHTVDRTLRHSHGEHQPIPTAISSIQPLSPIEPASTEKHTEITENAGHLICEYERLARYDITDATVFDHQRRHLCRQSFVKPWVFVF